ncbi:hypothetical protein GOP47_0025720 [Adiantum capillus-veneris]|uniref:Uncharacterized protein n=1 Tax=Adiantum capillus-veneris TaxID=13818 RepID=A0A9D4U390_ADICA|nr:hypothetical protein GOP47_0025720 [Adiantum capillus-veneris]
MAESSYDVLFDRNVDFIATFSRTLEEGNNFNGEAIFRWQRTARDINNFVELNMSTWTQSLKVTTCAFYPSVGLGMFSSWPVLPVSRFRSSKDSALGLRYGSSNISIGTVINPAFRGPSCIWFVGKMGKITAGCQCKPRHSSTTPRYAWSEFEKPPSWSYAVDYGGGKSGPLSPSFNFCLEAQDSSKLIASYYHHLVVQRQVRNPFEGPEVIAITNYIDVGFEFQQSLAESAKDSETVGHETPAMQIGASWQANKNILLKGKLGTTSSAFALLLKSWWDPSFTMSFSAMRDHLCKDTTFGFGVQVENFGGARYERADPTYVMVIPTKQDVVKEMMEKNPNVRPMLSTNVMAGLQEGSRDGGAQMYNVLWQFEDQMFWDFFLELCRDVKPLILRERSPTSQARPDIVSTTDLSMASCPSMSTAAKVTSSRGFMLDRAVVFNRTRYPHPPGDLYTPIIGRLELSLSIMRGKAAQSVDIHLS